MCYGFVDKVDTSPNNIGVSQTEWQSSELSLILTPSSQYVFKIYGPDRAMV